MKKMIKATFGGVMVGLALGQMPCTLFGAENFVLAPEKEQIASLLPEGKWKLIFNDEFSGPLADVDPGWVFQNSPSLHTLCSRWRENASISNGILHLKARKETRGGQDWTAASLNTRRLFKYGYFECRYRYAKAPGTNNSFWLMTLEGSGADKKGGKFEIDINEGHAPNKINMNIHNWSGKHWANHKKLIKESMDLSDTYHLYGLMWSESELVWYFDGQEIRREPNTNCYLPAPIFLSLAIINWAGPVTDAIDGASMDVDFVRVYENAD